MGHHISIIANIENFTEACCNGNLTLAKWVLFLNPYIDISHDDDFVFAKVCARGHLDLAQWLFHCACAKGHLDVCQWLQSLNPYLYVLEYDENGKYKGFRIRAKEEANWEKRKYLVWMASNDCPEENKSNLLYKLPSDVSRMLIGFV